LRNLVFILLLCLLTVVLSGCPTGQATPSDTYTADSPCAYSASSIHVIGLTSLGRDPQRKNSSQLSIYVSLLDSFDSSIKSPGSFRFELYEYVPRSSQPKGKRLAVWPDIELIDAGDNEKYWQDLLRAYHFTLDVNINPDIAKTYALQATCMTGDGKRISEIFILNPKK
jgi:hypothetical protein